MKMLLRVLWSKSLLGVDLLGVGVGCSTGCCWGGSGVRLGGSLGVYCWLGSDHCIASCVGWADYLGDLGVRLTA